MFLAQKQHNMLGPASINYVSGFCEYESGVKALFGMK